MALSQEQEGTAAFTLPGLEIEAVDNAVAAAKFDLQITMVQHADSLNLTWTYATDLFTGTSVDGFAQRFHRILAQIVETPEVAIADIAVLDENEYTRLTSAFGPSAPTVRTLADLLTRHSESANVAIVSESYGEMTYSELDVRSSQLARLLIERGIAPKQLLRCLFHVRRSPSSHCGLLPSPEQRTFRWIRRIPTSASHTCWQTLQRWS